MNIPSNEASSITVERIDCGKETFEVPANSSSFSKWVGELGVGGEELSDLTRSTLEEVKENCVTLDELDPGNKCKFIISLIFIFILFMLFPFFKIS